MDGSSTAAISTLCLSLCAAIALHGPSDVRPVLDSYKAEGDGKVMQVFKTKQVIIRMQQWLNLNIVVSSCAGAL